MAPEEQITYDLVLLEASDAKWRRSPGLRAVYADLYRRIGERLVEGPTLELGSGIGNGKEFIPDLVTSDLVKTPFVDRGVSCYAIEETEAPDGAWANLVAVDVLHHLREPMTFFASAARSLRPGGHVVLMEPAATFFGRLFYRVFHHEPIVPERIDPPFSFEPDSPEGDFANMGMGVGLFLRHRAEVAGRLADIGLRLTGLTFGDSLAYPLSGGYSKPQLIPTAALRALLALERILPQLFYRAAGLRMLIVLERTEVAPNV